MSITAVYTYKNESNSVFTVGNYSFQPQESKTYSYTQPTLDEFVPSDVLTRFIGFETDENTPLEPLQQHEQDHRQIHVNPDLPGEPNGFVDVSQINLLWDNGTRTLTLEPTADTIEFYTNGYIFYKHVTETIQLPNVTGNYIVYYDSQGVLQYHPGFDIQVITVYAFVASLYWNATYSKVIPDVLYELHGCQMPAKVHLYNHNTIGTTYQSGLTPTVISEATGSLPSHAQVSVTTGVVWDEDLKHTIPVLTMGDSIRHMYREGATGTWTYEDSVYLVLNTGTGRAAYNQWTGTIWQKSEVPNNDFVLAHLYAFPGTTTKWITIIGQNRYSTISAARAAAFAEGNNITGVPMLEYKLVASILLQTADSITNPSKSRVRDTIAGEEQFIDWRLTSNVRIS